MVGSDGSASSVHAVQHAAGVAHAADARLVVVSAFNPGAPDTGAKAIRKEIYGEEAARSALDRSVEPLLEERKRRTVDRRLIAGDPGQALLDVAGDDPANLIVVGNRGLGALEGELLGSVPRHIVQHAVCDVLIVQTGSRQKT